MAAKKMNGAKSGRQLANRLDLSESGFRKFRDSHYWPTNIGKRPPWPESAVQQLIQVREQMAEPNDDEVLEGMSHERRARLQLLIERGAKVRVERLILQGSYIEKERVVDRSVKQILAVKFLLLEQPRRLATELAATDNPQECERILEDALRALLQKFADGHAGDYPQVIEVLEAFERFVSERDIKIGSKD